jgi:hypothetical protein
VKAAAFVFALLMLAAPFQTAGLLWAADSPDEGEQWSQFTYKPYTEEEFARWLIDLRRAESLFFGSLPLTYGVIRLTENLILGDSGEIGTDGFILRLSAAAGISAVLAASDYILGRLSGE